MDEAKDLTVFLEIQKFGVKYFLNILYFRLESKNQLFSCGFVKQFVRNLEKP